MADRNIKIEIVVDSDGAVRKLKEFDGATEQVEKRVKSATPLIGGLASTITAYASGYAIGAAIKSTVQYADDLKTMGDRTGIAVKELQRLSFAAGQNGSDIQAVTTVIGTLGDRLATGDKSVRKAVKDLGLEFAAVRAMRIEDSFKVIGRELAEVDNISKRIQIAKDLGGMQGFGILPTWISDMEELGDQAERLGLIVGKDAVESAAKFDSAMSAAWMGLKAQIMDVITLGPSLRSALPMLFAAGDTISLFTGAGADPKVPSGPHNKPATNASFGAPSAEDAQEMMDKSFGAVRQQLEKLDAEIKKKLADEAEALSKFIITQNDQRMTAATSFFEQDVTMLVGHLERKRNIELQNAEREFTTLANKEIAKLAIVKNFQEQERALRIAAQTQLLHDIDAMQGAQDARQKGMGMPGTLDSGPALSPIESQFNQDMEALIKLQEQATMQGLSTEVERLSTMRTALENEYVLAMNAAGAATTETAQSTVAAAGATTMNAMALNAVTQAAGTAGVAMLQLGDNLNLVTQQSIVGAVRQGGGQFGGPASGIDMVKAVEAYNIAAGTFGFTSPGANPVQDFPAWLNEQMKSPLRGFAHGGIVDRPTLAIVGEGGEREFIIPESKMGGGGIVIQIDARGAVFEDDRSLDRLTRKIEQKMAAKYGQGTRLPGRA